MNKFFVRGLGFFNDAYDLFVMNIVNVVLTEQYGKEVYTPTLKAGVSAAALIGAVIGQLLFGYLGDVFGRRVNMIATCSLLIIGGLLCTVGYGGTPTGTIWFLIFARGLLGIGIGGEYPLAASATAEDATSVHDRNHRVALTFSLQGVGSLVAAILGNLLVEILAPEHLEIIWRTLFGLGVVPAIVVCYYRLIAEETEAFKATQERNQMAFLAPSSHSDEDNKDAVVVHLSRTHTRKTRVAFILQQYGKGLIGTAGTWFLFDIVFYAQNLFSASMLSVVGVQGKDSLEVITTQNVLIALMALPGYYVAVCFINRLGRRMIQIQGFCFMLVLFLVLGIWWKEIQKSPVAFISLYGLSLFFANFGPNMSTFVLPTEMFPTQIRSSCHGFSAAMGKAGAAIGSFGFAMWVEDPSFGYDGAFYTFALLCLVALPLTWFCTFDNHRSMEEMDQEFEDRLALADQVTRESFQLTSTPKDLLTASSDRLTTYPKSVV